MPGRLSAPLAGQAGTNLTSHPGSRTTTYLVDHVADPDLPGAAHVDHWYLLSAADHLHLNPAGYRLLADSAPLALIR